MTTVIKKLGAIIIILGLLLSGCRYTAMQQLEREIEEAGGPSSMIAIPPTEIPAPTENTRVTKDFLCQEEVDYLLAINPDMTNVELKEFLYADYTVGEWIYLRACWEEGWRID